ncbi:MAG TPA: type II secretion system minor pseudopilin GspK [Gammaproteobacteria bacterium]
MRTLSGPALMRTGYRHQYGVALITALLILALATTAAVFLTNQHQLSIRRTGNIITGNQAYLYVLGGEALAMSVLNHDRKNTQFDALNEEWAMDAAPLPVDGGFIQGELHDLQGRFNINNLFQNGKVEPVWVARFEKLLAQFAIDPALTSAVIDWMDPDQNANGTYGAEDDYYVGMVPPYRAANAPIKSLSELRLIRGLNNEPQKLDLLMQHLTALPEQTVINVNTASREILVALGLDPFVAEEITRQTGVFLDPQLNTAMNANTDANANMQPYAGANADANRAAGGNSQTTATGQPIEDPMAAIVPFETLEQFNQAARTGQIEGFNPQGLDIGSNYFLFEGYAEVDRGRALLKSLLHRDNSGIMRVVVRSQGDL